MNTMHTNLNAPAHLNKPRILSNGALFAALDKQELEILARFASVHNVRADAVIFTQGSEGDTMYVIVRGRVQISLVPDGGNKIIVGVLQQGGMFGEVSLLDGGKRTATVEALEPCELLSIRREDLLGYLQRQPLVAIKFLAVLAARVRSTDELIADSLTTNLPARLAKTILKLARAYGYNTSQGIKIDVKLYVEELVYRSGIPKEKVIAQLDAWIEKGLLEVRKSRLVILEPYELAILV
jgi:CRP/FNR family transcriptional regulator, cyclic AMP receptor protein